MGKTRLDCGRKEPEDVAALLAAGFDPRQHRLDETAAGGARRPKLVLPPNDQVTQGPLARIVRRLDPFMPQKHPLPQAMLVQVPAGPARVGVAAWRAAQQQAFYRPTDSAHFLPRAIGALFAEKQASHLPADSAHPTHHRSMRVTDRGVGA